MEAQSLPLQIAEVDEAKPERFFAARLMQMLHHGV
jgi:hypothetical protein